MERVALIRVGLLAATLALYAPALGFDFVNFDDHAYVLEVGMVSRGLDWEGVRWAFSQRHGVEWQPVTWLSHMLDFTLFGSEPAGHHLTSALLHAANALLLFELLRRLTNEALPSAFAAALFAWHPLRVESVAWVAERKDVLSASFGLLALHAWTGWVRRGAAWRYAASLGFLTLGLLAKRTLVTLPFLLLLLDHWPFGRLVAWRDLPARLREKVPHLVLAAAGCAVSLLTQGSAMPASGDLLLVERIANAALAYPRYLGKLLWPADLIVHYAHPYMAGTGGQAPPAWLPWLCGGGLFAATAVALRPGAPRHLRVGWLWFLGALIPMIGLVQVGTQALADRYTYLPGIGLALLISWSGRDLLVRLAPPVRTACALAAVLALAALVARTDAQLQVWRSSTHLFEHAIALEPENAIVNTNLAHAYQSAGRIAEAEQHLRRALRINPRSVIAHYDYGNVLRQMGRLAECEQQYREALRIEPRAVKVAANLAGVVQLQGRREEAIALHRAVLALEPGDPTSTLNLAGLLREPSQLPEAIELYRRQLARTPEDARIWVSFAAALRASGHLDPAIAALRTALSLAPDLADAHAGLGNALGARGELESAAEHLRRALELRPDHANARANLELTTALLAKRAHGSPGPVEP